MRIVADLQIVSVLAYAQRINDKNNGLSNSDQSPFSNFYKRINMTRVGTESASRPSDV